MSTRKQITQSEARRMKTKIASLKSCLRLQAECGYWDGTAISETDVTVATEAAIRTAIKLNHYVLVRPKYTESGVTMRLIALSSRAELDKMLGK